MQKPDFKPEKGAASVIQLPKFHINARQEDQNASYVDVVGTILSALRSYF